MKEIQGKSILVRFSVGLSYWESTVCKVDQGGSPWVQEFLGVTSTLMDQCIVIVEIIIENHPFIFNQQRWY